MSAQEALSLGLISRVFPTESLVDEAIQLGERISGFSKIAVAMCKEAVNAAEQLPLNEGLLNAWVKSMFIRSCLSMLVYDTLQCPNRTLKLLYNCENTRVFAYLKLYLSLCRAEV